MTGDGWIAADAALCFLSLCAAVSCYYASSNLHQSRIKRISLIVSGFGWSLFSLRLYSLLQTGNDPTIPPVSLTALSLVASAAVVHEVANVFEGLKKYGRRIDDRDTGNAH